MKAEPWAVGLTLLAVLLGAFGPILFKKASSGSLRPGKLAANRHFLGGLLCYGLATAAYVPALRGGDLSVLYPLISLSFAVVSLLSMWILKERMSRAKWAGIALIVLGVSLIGAA